MATPRFVRYTDPDGNMLDGILLSSAPGGEGVTTDIVIPLDRGSGAGTPVEAASGSGPGTYSEVA